MKNSVAEMLGALISAGISVFGLLEALNYSGQSGMMPQAVTAFAIFLSLIWFVNAAKLHFSGQSEFEFAELRLAGLAKIIGGILIYVLSVRYVGFFTATIVAVPAFAYLIGYRNLKVSFATAVGFVLILYAVFSMLLNVPLPDEAIVDVITRAIK